MRIALYKSPNNLAKCLIIFLIAEIIVSFTEASEFAKTSTTGAPESQQAPTTDLDYYWNIVDTVVNFSVIALFVCWFFRTYHNLQALGVEGLRYSARRVIISFFIPVWNLFEPIKGLKDLWRASDPRVDISNGYSWKVAATPLGLGVWWFFAVATRFHDVGELHWFGTPELVRPVQMLSDLVIVPFSLLIINIATIIIVKRICSRQEKKRQLIEAGA
jgi:hypothetical protein